jgi:hypothetical protein
LSIRSSLNINFFSVQELVNVYGSDASISSGDRPKPLKTIGNLTTLISTLQFNHDSQLLTIASKDRKHQMHMVCFIFFTALAALMTPCFSFLFADPLTISKGVCGLANGKHAFGTPHDHRLLDWQRICSYCEQSEVL